MDWLDGDGRAEKDDRVSDWEVSQVTRKRVNRGSVVEQVSALDAVNRFGSHPGPKGSGRSAKSGVLKCSHDRPFKEARGRRATGDDATKRFAHASEGERAGGGER